MKFEDWAWFFLGILTGAAVLLLFYVVYISAKPNLELDKEMWACTDVRKTPVVINQFIGKVAIPTVHIHDVCFQWTAKK